MDIDGAGPDAEASVACDRRRAARTRDVDHVLFTARVGETAASNGSLAVRQVTTGAAGGPFVFELADAAAVPLVQHGIVTTDAEGEAVDVAGLGGDLAAGTYTLRQDQAQLPAELAGGHWEFTGVECDGAPVTVDAPTGTATLTLDAGAAATCIVTNTWVADAATYAESRPLRRADLADLATGRSGRCRRRRHR